MGTNFQIFIAMYDEQMGVGEFEELGTGLISDLNVKKCVMGF